MPKININKKRKIIYSNIKVELNTKIQKNEEKKKIKIKNYLQQGNNKLFCF